MGEKLKVMEQYLDEYRHSMYNDWNGNPVERTPDKYRYLQCVIVLELK